MMKRGVLIVGAGGVAHVVAHKCAQHNDVLGDIHIASRTVSKCEAIIRSVQEKGNLKQPGILCAHALDARDVESTAALIVALGVHIVINAGAPFINDAVLQACLRSGVAYLDTAIHEDPSRVCETPPWYGNYEWKQAAACEARGVTAILGAGFDPGVVNAYAALACQSYFDEVDSIDILDVNAGKHDRWFATNFDPETNFREFTGRVWSWQRGEWQQDTMFAVQQTYDFPVVGQQTVYLTGHDEVHSLSKHLPVPTIRFWMGFSEHYINVFTVLNKLGLLSEQPVRLDSGQEVVPLKVIKAVLPDPASLAPAYTGKTCIGNLVKGRKGGESRELFLYNLCDHANAYAEVGSQAIAYTAGVPAVAAAILVTQGTWDVKRMANVEQLPPEPFLALLARMGLTTRLRDADGDRELFGAS